MNNSKRIPLLLALCLSLAAAAGQDLDSILRVYVQTPEEAQKSFIVKAAGLCKLDETCHLEMAAKLRAAGSPHLKFYLERAGFLFHNAGDYERSRSWFRRSLEADPSNREHRGIIYNLLATSFFRQSNYDSVAYYRQKAQTILEEEESYYRWQVYAWTSQDFLVSAQNETALAWMERAYQITKPRNIRMDNGYVLYHLVKMTLDMGAPQYHQYLEEYLEFKRTGTGELDLQHDAVLNYLADNEAAKRQLIEFTKEENLRDNPSGSIDYSLQLLGNLYRREGEFKQAEAYLRKSADLSRSLQKTFAELESYQYLYELAKESSNTPLKLESLEQILLLKDSLSNRQFDEEIAKMEVAFQTREKEIALELAQRKNNALLAGLGALLIIALLLFWTIRQKRRANALLASKNAIIEKALEEKEFLIKEIHHRVKNNLQIISSLLQLQSRYIDEPLALEALNDGESRVRSMAIIHHHLYSQENLSQVDVRKYVANLCDNLRHSYNINNLPIQIHQDIDDIALDVSVMIPLGLILNELITNCFKYAFSGRATGNIWVGIREEADGLLVSVKDDGAGMDPSAVQAGFGDRLIKAFVRKLDAEMETLNDDGAEVRIRVREYAKEPLQQMRV
jgi:two-component sensor histidine kinase